MNFGTIGVVDGSSTSKVTRHANGSKECLPFDCNLFRALSQVQASDCELDLISFESKIDRIDSVLAAAAAGCRRLTSLSPVPRHVGFGERERGEGSDRTLPCELPLSIALPASSLTLESRRARNLGQRRGKSQVKSSDSNTSTSSGRTEDDQEPFGFFIEFVLSAERIAF